MKDTKMLFDGEQTEFKSELHEKIYAMGRLIVPFEVSTAKITDKVMLEGLRQVYDFTVELFSDMYENPDKFKITYERKLIEGKSFYENTGTRTESFHQHLYFLTRHFAKHEIILPNDVEWTVPAYQKSHISFETLDQLALMGIYYENNDGTTLIKSSKYPLFLKYFSMLCNEAGQKLKVGIFDCVVTCDFRIFTKGFGRKIDDTTRAVSESNKAFILETHNHLISKGIKTRPRGYYDLRYEYKKQVLLDTKLVLLMYLDFRVPLGNRPDDEQYKAIIAEIENQPNKDELLRYIVHNIGCCNFCYGNRAISCGGYHKEFFGEQRHLCGFFALRVVRYKDRNIYNDDHDITMLKQIIDLRIKVIDNLIP